MRIFYPLYQLALLLVTTNTIKGAFGEADCSSDDPNCWRVDPIFNGQYFGSQRVDHEEDIKAFVFRPSLQGENSAREHFRRKWMEDEVNEEEDTEKEPTLSPPEILEGFSESHGSFEGTGANYNNDGESNANVTRKTIPPIDPNDPEELFKHKQIRSENPFSKIVSINQGTDVADLHEGDMKFPPLRNGGGDTWPKSRFGTMAGLVAIPYKIATKYNDTERTIIKSAISLYHKHTCIRFVPRRSEISYIYITDAKGCWAYVGKTGYSAQTVSLGRPGCLAKGIVAHELMHVVGFQHEHSRSDRDKYVTILEQNIQRDMKQNFDVHKNTKNLVIYDYNSVMHYSKNAFSKFQYLPAIQITPKRKPEPDIGQRERMSPYDIEEVKYLYNCADGTFQRCGRDFIDSRGDSFTSPRYPKPYPAESHCTWKIAVAKGLYISLTITNLDIENSKLCQKDAILVHDGENAAATQLSVICGTASKATTVVSTGNTLFVIFTSDPNSKGSHKGFRASFKISHSKGTLPKPLAPSPLPPIKAVQNSFSCDFEFGTCGMIQDTLDEIDWIRYKGSTPSQGTGPSGDHSSGKGYYMYVESSLPSKLGDNAIVRSPWLKRERQSCILFAYHMLGAYMGTMRLYAYEKRKSSRFGQEVLLWERHGNQGNQWIEESVGYKPKSDVQFVQYYWEAFVFFYQSDFGLDDVVIKPTGCDSSYSTSGSGTTIRVIGHSTIRTTRSPRVSTTSKTTTTTSPTTTIEISTSPVSESICDFDSGLCGWKQDKINDNFDWIRTNKPTPSQNTGPQTDHTTSTGYFLFIEASSPRILGDVARLLSPRLTKGPHCLKMWYHMYGTQMGSLSIKQINGQSTTTLIEKNGNMGKEWLYLELDIVTPAIKTARSSKNAFLQLEDYTQISIEAVRGLGYPGDLAIDDVTITSSPCDSQPTTSTTAYSYLKNVRCNFDSKDDLCGFSNSDVDDFDWSQNSGKTQSGSTGPNADHTKGDSSGSYMYIEASSPRKSKQIAKLVSPKLSPGKYCVRFYVHMWGSGMGDVLVYSVEYANDKSSTRKNQWMLKGSQGDSWIKGEFEFQTSISISYVEVEFVGVIGSTFTSDAAVDDVSITGGSCKKVSTISTTKSEINIVTKPPSTTKKTATSAKSITKTVTRKVSLTSTILTVKPISTTPPTNRRSLTQAKSTTAKPRRSATKRKSTTTTAKPKISFTKPTLTTIKEAVTTASRSFLRNKTTTNQSITKISKKVTTKKPDASYTISTAAKTDEISPTSKTRTATTRPTKTVRPSITKRVIYRATRPATTAIPIINVAPNNRHGGRSLDSTSSPKTTRSMRKITPKKISEPSTSIGGVPNVHKQDFVCDFESDKYCGMMQLKGDNFDWIRHFGSTPSSGTGPLTDHTSPWKSSGHYIYIEASDPRRPRDNAIIATPPLSTRPEKRCVTFWYHMHGKGTGTLRVWSEIAHNGIFKKFAAKAKRELEFSQSGPKGNSWKMAQFTLKISSTNSAATLRLQFEGIVGTTYRSDIAVDDICISSSSCDFRSHCKKQPIETSTSKAHSLKKVISTTTPAITKFASANKRQPSGATRSTVTRNHISTKSPIISSSSSLPREDLSAGGMHAIMRLCTFDAKVKKSNPNGVRAIATRGRLDNDEFCGWKQEARKDDFDWTWKSGITPSSYTGPSGDHTSGKGHYLFIEASAPRSAKDFAILRSDKLYPTSYCVDLYYNMYGKGTGQLVVRAQQETTEKPFLISNLKIIKGQQGRAWGHLQVNYKPRPNVKSVRFRIDGEVGKDYTSDIAIDDLSVNPGRCDSCSKPNKRFKDRFGQVKTFFSGCIHDQLFYVKCCGLAEQKIKFKKVKKCTPNSMTVEKLNMMCYYS